MALSNRKHLKKLRREKAIWKVITKKKGRRILNKYRNKNIAYYFKYCFLSLED